MSLPVFSSQSELFSTAGLSGKLFPETDRYRLFARLVYPHLAAVRGALERWEERESCQRPRTRLRASSSRAWYFAHTRGKVIYLFHLLEADIQHVDATQP